MRVNVRTRAAAMEIAKLARNTTARMAQGPIAARAETKKKIRERIQGSLNSWLRDIY
jgi:plasmid rolling circle replication initiator protein Rep